MVVGGPHAPFARQPLRSLCVSHTAAAPSLQPPGALRRRWAGGGKEPRLPTGSTFARPPHLQPPSPPHRVSPRHAWPSCGTPWRPRPRLCHGGACQAFPVALATARPPGSHDHDGAPPGRTDAGPCGPTAPLETLRQPEVPAARRGRSPRLALQFALVEGGVGRSRGSTGTCTKRQLAGRARCGGGHAHPTHQRRRPPSPTPPPPAALHALLPTPAHASCERLLVCGGSAFAATLSSPSLSPATHE